MGVQEPVDAGQHRLLGVQRDVRIACVVLRVHVVHVGTIGLILPSIH
jgi:hypothetical protein